MRCKGKSKKNCFCSDFRAEIRVEDLQHDVDLSAVITARVASLTRVLGTLRTSIEFNESVLTCELTLWGERCEAFGEAFFVEKTGVPRFWRLRHRRVFMV